MKHTVALCVALIAAWLLWSGLTVRVESTDGGWSLGANGLLVVTGLLSVLLVIVLVRRMKLVDEEGEPVHLLLRLPGYTLYLIWEVVKANLDVARRILHPGLPIDPRLIRVKAGQKTDLGRVIYANSITLTPGTVSVDLEGDVVVVHALSREAADGVETGKMDRRVCRLERNDT